MSLDLGLSMDDYPNLQVLRITEGLPCGSRRCRPGVLWLPGAKPMNVKAEDISKTGTNVERRHRDALSPVLHVGLAQV